MKGSGKEHPAVDSKQATADAWNGDHRSYNQEQPGTFLSRISILHGLIASKPDVEMPAVAPPVSVPGQHL